MKFNFNVKTLVKIGYTLLFIILILYGLLYLLQYLKLKEGLTPEENTDYNDVEYDARPEKYAKLQSLLNMNKNLSNLDDSKKYEDAVQTWNNINDRTGLDTLPMTQDELTTLKKGVSSAIKGMRRNYVDSVLSTLETSLLDTMDDFADVVEDPYKRIAEKIGNAIELDMINNISNEENPEYVVPMN